MTLWKKDENPSPEPEEPETFDIILCDYCDAEFYSEEAFSVSAIRILIKNRV